MNVKTILLSASLVISFSLAPKTQSMTDDESSDPGVQVTVTEVTQDELSPSIPVAGTVHSRNATQITAGLEARLSWVAEPGDFVSAGEAVAKFDCDMLSLQREEQLVQIESEQIRYQSLVKEVERLESAQLAVAITQLDRQRADRDLARSEMRMAQVRVKQTDNTLERCVSVAPFAGTVTEQLRRTGEDVPRGEVLATMTDTQNLEVRASVPVRYLPRMVTGNLAKVRLYDTNLNGKIRTAVPAADAMSQTFEVRIDLPAVAPDYVAAGQLVSVTLPLNSRTALTVPRDSIVLREEGAYVMRIDAQGEAHSVMVEVDDASGERVSIEGALNPGDLVALRGAEALQEGERVIIFTDI